MKCASEYNRVLTASEIAAIASPPTSGLADYRKFNENAGTQTIDSASTGLSVTSNEALLTVAAGSGPTATINLPVTDTHYNAGDTINFSGSATDPDEILGTAPSRGGSISTTTITRIRSCRTQAVSPADRSSSPPSAKRLRSCGIAST